uniref:Reverse transcriptase domain-containing protein n=1 Tax=Scylla olivacea TaxID=85551 RepID=A0A0P4W158_SCYOL
MMRRIRVIQHNVLTWDTRKFDLINTYRQFDPDIVLINSHGLKDEKRLKIPGFRTYQQNFSNEQMDGVAIAIRKTIRHRIEDDFLSETLAVVIESPDGPLTIATSYLPPRRPFIPHPDFLRLFRRQSPVFLAGDLNARHPTLGTATTNQVGRDLIDYLRRQTAKHIGPNFPTYYGPFSSSSPDIVLTNRLNFLHYTITPGPLTTSDHIPLILDISTSPLLTPTLPTYAYHRTNWEQFTNDNGLQMTNYHDISQASLEEIDRALQIWTYTVKTTADRHIPKTTYRVDPQPRPSRLTQITRIQFDALREQASQTGWTIANYRRYIQLRHTLTDRRRQESKDHWGSRLASLAVSHTNPRVFWKKVKQLSGRSVGPDSYLIDDQGHRHYSDADKARLHTSTWERVFQEEDELDSDEEDVLDRLRPRIQDTHPYGAADPTRLRGDSPLNCRISSLELTRAIRSTKATCPGKSGINKTILSHLPVSALDRLREILNASLSAGYFPDGWKEAEMRLVVKAGKAPTSPASYRPISLLEVPGKMFERIVTSRLRDHLDGHGLYHPGQFGFRRGRGTTHAIAVATETLALHQASRFRCHLVLRDVSKAFDKVWHLGLKYKVLQLGLPDPVTRLLCDFLADRTARIKVGSHLGPVFGLQSGVPQGSVLSPTLYTIYTSDYPGSAAGTNILYADDVSQVVFHPGRSGAMLNARTEREITRVNDFEKRWKIKTNLAKFTVIPMAAHRPVPLHVQGVPVAFKRQGSILGLRVTGRGYTTHITARVAQARSALASLYRFRDLEEGIKLHLVKALVIPVLTYPPIPTHAMSRRAISRLQKVQNSALRFTFNTNLQGFITSEELHHRASLPAINVRLHLMAEAVWQRLKDDDGEYIRNVLRLHEEAPNQQHAWFPRSLLITEGQDAPLPRYK